VRRRHAVFREAAHGAALIAAAGAVLWVTVLLPSRLKTERIDEQRLALLAETKDLEKEVRDLEAETRALDQDPYEMEKVLRARLGFLRPGERVVVVSK
jgi:hypothetical protein